MVYFSLPVSLELHLIDLCASLLIWAFLFLLFRVTVLYLQICLTLFLSTIGSVQAWLIPSGDHVDIRLLLGVWWLGSRDVFLSWLWCKVALIHFWLRTLFLDVITFPLISLADLSFTFFFVVLASRAWLIFFVFNDGIHHSGNSSPSHSGSILNYWRCWLLIFTTFLGFLGFVSKALQLLNWREHGWPSFI